VENHLVVGLQAAQGRQDPVLQHGGGVARKPRALLQGSNQSTKGQLAHRQGVDLLFDGVGQAQGSIGGAQQEILPVSGIVLQRTNGPQGSPLHQFSLGDLVEGPELGMIVEGEVLAHGRQLGEDVAIPAGHGPVAGGPAEVGEDQSSRNPGHQGPHLAPQSRHELVAHPSHLWTRELFGPAGAFLQRQAGQELSVLHLQAVALGVVGNRGLGEGGQERGRGLEEPRSQSKQPPSQLHAVGPGLAGLEGPAHDEVAVHRDVVHLGDALAQLLDLPGFEPLLIVFEGLWVPGLDADLQAHQADLLHCLKELRAQAQDVDASLAIPDEVPTRAASIVPEDLTELQDPGRVGHEGVVDDVEGPVVVGFQVADHLVGHAAGRAIAITPPMHGLEAEGAGVGAASARRDVEAQRVVHQVPVGVGKRVQVLHRFRRWARHKAASLPEEHTGDGCRVSHPAAEGLRQGKHGALSLALHDEVESVVAVQGSPQP